MSQKSFLLWVLSTLGIITLIVIGVKSAGYTLERPLGLSDFKEWITQSGSTAGDYDCSTLRANSIEQQNCKDNQANMVFTDYMNLSDTEKLSFNCRKLLAREQQKLCVQEKTQIPERQKQEEILKQLASGGDISLCDNFSSEKLEQDRCRLDFVMDRIPHSIPVTASGSTPIQRKPEMKDCALVEKYNLKDRCEQEKEMMKKMESNQLWTIQPIK